MSEAHEQEQADYGLVRRDLLKLYPTLDEFILPKRLAVGWAFEDSKVGRLALVKAYIAHHSMKSIIDGMDQEQAIDKLMDTHGICQGAAHYLYNRSITCL